MLVVECIMSYEGNKDKDIEMKDKNEDVDMEDEENKDENEGYAQKRKGFDRYGTRHHN